MPHQIIFAADAAAEYEEFVKRHTDAPPVLARVREVILAIAQEPGIAQKYEGPGDFRIHVFTCGDENKMVPVRLVFQLKDGNLIIISLNTQSL